MKQRTGRQGWSQRSPGAPSPATNLKKALALTHEHGLSPFLDEEELSPVGAARLHPKNDQVACGEHPEVRREQQLRQSAVVAGGTCEQDEEKRYCCSSHGDAADRAASGSRHRGTVTAAPPPRSGCPKISEPFPSIYSTFVKNFKRIIRTPLPVIFCIAVANKPFTKFVRKIICFSRLMFSSCACESHYTDPYQVPP